MSSSRSSAEKVTASGPGLPRLAHSYRCAESVARHRARNFYYSFLVLPAEKRRAFCAVYAFMRRCDDISDGDGALEGKMEQLQSWRKQLDPAADAFCPDNGILPAFHDTIRRFAIPAQYFHWILDGAEMDLTVARYETFADLYKYCFNVASAVGLVCLHIFGFTDERAKKHAEQCGIAFQLTNILRDVKEDARMGRVYLPQEDLARFRYAAADLKVGVVDDRFRSLMDFETSRAREYYEGARRLLPLIDQGSRPALWAMMEIYSGILDKIVRRGFDVFARSVRLSTFEKLSIAARALTMRFFAGGTGIR
jgi:phytoene synthase